MDNNKSSNFNQALWLGIGSLCTFLIAFLTAPILVRYFDKMNTAHTGKSYMSIQASGIVYHGASFRVRLFHSEIEYGTTEVAHKQAHFDVSWFRCYFFFGTVLWS